MVYEEHNKKRNMGKVLDICCCEGGAGVGYHRAGYEVYGIDLAGKFKKRYPFPFLHEDGLVAIRALIEGGSLTFSNGETLSLRDFSMIHASPPCQGYTLGNAGRSTRWPKLIPDFRELLQQTGAPYVIENVRGAQSEMLSPIGLCGCMFNLTAVDEDGETIHLHRLRLFETNWALEIPRECDHSGHTWVAGAYGGARRDKYEAKFIRKGGYVPRNKDVVKSLLGVKHEMTWNGLFESVPPAYTEWIGQQLKGCD